MFVLALLLVAASTALPGDPCGTPEPGGRARAFVVVSRAAPTDTVVTATVCVQPAEAAGSPRKVGSYHGELAFDSTQARVTGVEKPSGGVRVENTSRSGMVKFAGADPAGFETGEVLRVLLHLRRPGRAPQLRLKIIELNATDGSSLLKHLATSAPDTR